MTDLLDRSHLKPKLGPYAEASEQALLNKSYLFEIRRYKTRNKARPLDREAANQKIPRGRYHISRKIDGETDQLVYVDGQAFLLNPGGRIRTGLPLLDEAVRLLGEAGVKQALLVGEFYVRREDRRTRVHDILKLSRRPGSYADLERLFFGIFDYIQVDNISPEDFEQRWETIEHIFGRGQRVHPVEAAWGSEGEVSERYRQWVEKEGSEGIVVRNDVLGTFKIKPRLTLDAVIIGFTESLDEREGMLHDLLVGLVRVDGSYHVLGRVGGGFSDEERVHLLKLLRGMAVESTFTMSNSERVGYEFIRPERVVELSCVDLVAETTKGGTIDKMVLQYKQGWNPVRRLPIVSIISPQFVRLRPDKRVAVEDAGLDQVSRIVEVPKTALSAADLDLPRSKPLKRSVYAKHMSGGTMVRKVMLWRTQKEEAAFPAFVAYLTDFSPNRVQLLRRELRIAHTHAQAIQEFEALETGALKTGWELVVDPGDVEIQVPLPTKVNLVVVGFSEKGDASLDDVLLAVQNKNHFCIIGRHRLALGSADYDSVMDTLFSIKVGADFNVANGRGVAYHLVEPHLVVELLCQGLEVSQDTRHATMTWNAGHWQKAQESSRLAIKTPMSARLVPLSVTADTTGEGQVAMMGIDHALEKGPTRSLSRLKREVWIKQGRTGQMVRKLVLYEESDGFVLVGTDFSAGRAKMLNRELRVSTNREDIERHYLALRTQYAKTGWVSI